MDTERTTCVVAGGGPAGMVLGLLLARAGIEVTVLEKHADFLRDFRGDTVHASTLRLLDELGLGEAFDRLPHSLLDRVEFPTPDGGSVLVGDLRRLPGHHQHIALVPQWDFLELLAEAARTEPTFTLRMSTEATELVWEDGKVAGVEYRTAAGRMGELRAELVVAADGRWSSLRAQAHLRPREYPVPVDAWWFRMPRYDGDPGEGLTARMRGSEMAVTINRGDYYQIAYLNRKGFDATLRAEGLARFRQRIANLLPPLADRVDSIASLDDVKFLDVRCNRLRRWHTDGLLCIGDAAHAMSPIGGVGINLAIQDAVAAATLLAGPLTQHRISAGDLAKVRRRRWLPTALIQGMQRLMHKAFVRRAPVLPWIMRHLPPLRFVTAYFIAIGPRPEHAPAFARRVSTPQTARVDPSDRVSRPLR